LLTHSLGHGGLNLFGGGELARLDVGRHFGRRFGHGSEHLYRAG